MINDDEYAVCLRVLGSLCRDPLGVPPGSLAEQVVAQAAALLHVRKSLRRREMRQTDQQRLARTGIRQRRAGTAPAALSVPKEAQQKTPDLADLADLADSSDPPDSPGTLSRSKSCYICKARYTQLHFFYDSLCTHCAADNYQRRSQSADLRGRIALLTGGRLKIGFALGLKLLRAGATVLVTTRFPADALRRYQREPDHQHWAQRLHIHGLDLRHLPSIEAFADQVTTHVPHLDILINNAAQTIRRPAAYYRHLLPQEVLRPPAGHLPAASEPPTEVSQDLPGLLPFSALLSQRPLLPEDYDAPLGPPDQDGQPRDLRPNNSWTFLHHEVPVAELLEVHAINSIAPFLLIQRMRPLLLRSPHRHRFIVNVSSMEGAFSMRQKSPRHPHTNMAKAGLNMLTHTCAGELAEHGIYLNSVDTGWITNEFPQDVAQRMSDSGFAPPLDEIDGAARICDPIFSGLASGAPVYGCFLKDYRAIDW